jgi:hypothetical protein
MTSFKDFFELADEQWKKPLLAGIMTSTCMMITYDILLLFVFALQYLIIIVLIGEMIVINKIINVLLKNMNYYKILKPKIIWIGGLYGIFYVIEWIVKMSVYFDFFFTNNLVPPTFISFIVAFINFIYIGSIVKRERQIKN